ncbi:right-handed parallel beta-helix repeat-containing protein [bacterium]|nr:right-handed parallel beta-helix repeat-containing protein [bacterium]MBU1650965.1 right-handed parallel beta-helix repeat-containing protein [bacterium]
MKKVLTICVLVVLLSALMVHAIPLQQAYTEAQPGAGYDKMIVLDPAETYTGGLEFDDESICIISCGALIDLQGDRIIANDNGYLDICGVALTNSDSAAIKVNTAGQGWIDHCTFAGNYDGVHFWIGTNLTMTSNIFSYSERWGVWTDESTSRFLAYNNAYSNLGGHYKEWCAG